MGATNFTTISSANTVNQAYDRACQDAEAECGSMDGYNGTISTTSGVVELHEGHFKGLRRDTRIMILEMVANGSPWEDDLKKLHGKSLAAYNALKGYPAADKWGRCYAVRLNHNTFAFSGLAAC